MYIQEREWARDLVGTHKEYKFKIVLWVAEHLLKTYSNNHLKLILGLSKTDSSLTP